MASLLGACHDDFVVKPYWQNLSIVFVLGCSAKMRRCCFANNSLGIQWVPTVAGSLRQNFSQIHASARYWVFGLESIAVAYFLADAKLHSAVFFGVASDACILWPWGLECCSFDAYPFDSSFGLGHALLFERDGFLQMRDSARIVVIPKNGFSALDGVPENGFFVLDQLMVIPKMDGSLVPSVESSRLFALL
ncbi:hypothetical protein Nepgr_026668 [Nepenthes gracilis]|uniref:Uncharacterized protein n=1 Tax=Nepenthes gracilis TaxID=150966 RepID=A0AAD3Y290_NEPGR|nr:hypothetical protein Nepgr_026668 [Nepenthes gracilis]